MTEFIVGLFGGVIGALLIDHAKAWWFNPRITAEFRPQTDPINRGAYQEINIRLRVTNTGRTAAHECLAYLMDVQRYNGDSDDLAYSDHLPLHWSYTQGDESKAGITLHSKASYYVDVCSARSNFNGIRLAVHTLSPRYEELFQATGIYILSVRVVANHAKPSDRNVWVKWTGNWNECKSGASYDDVKQ